MRAILWSSLLLQSYLILALKLQKNKIVLSSRKNGISFMTLSTTTDDVIIETTSEYNSESFKAPLNEIQRRRNFAIISHPDAGKRNYKQTITSSSF